MILSHAHTHTHHVHYFVIQKGFQSMSLFILLNYLPDTLNILNILVGAKIHCTYSGRLLEQCHAFTSLFSAKHYHSRFKITTETTTTTTTTTIKRGSRHVLYIVNNIVVRLVWDTKNLNSTISDTHTHPQCHRLPISFGMITYTIYASLYIYRV